jgi:hypothetical protein
MKNKNLNETVNLSVSASGDTPEDIISMFNKIMRPVNADMMPSVSKPMPMVKAIDTVSNYNPYSDYDSSAPTASTTPVYNKPKLMGQKGVEEEWANEPDEKMVKSVDGMTKDAGIQRKQVPGANKNMGDNPMSMEAYIREEYKKFKSAVTEQEKDDNILIAARITPLRKTTPEQINMVAKWVEQNKLGSIKPDKVPGKFTFIPADPFTHNDVTPRMQDFFDSLHDKFQTELFNDENWQITGVYKKLGESQKKNN